MADILIRGVQFPTMAQAYKTLIVSYDGKVYEGVCPQPTAKKKESIAHAIELPEHGDLIDRSEIKTNMVDEMLGKKVSYVNREQIINAPVIVPSNKEETEQGRIEYHDEV